MKLLASVVALASADYACCPYDVYGVPFSGCTLTEKTPWSFASSSHDPLGVEQNQCKSWEANIGAMNDGSSSVANGHSEDWGSCGFQRHFPWRNTNPTSATGQAAANTKCLLGYYTCVDGSAPVLNYKTLAVGTGHLSLASGVFSGPTSGTNQVTGDVTLGGVCKLFVPVKKASIRQVSVAGVHVANHRTAGAFTTEIDAYVSNTVNFHHGTVYCFSVVNLGEFVINSNNVANANVAGDSQQTDKVLTNQYAANINFGSTWPGNTGGTTTNLNGKVNVGANFDVVVHFNTDWCASHWTKVDMQKPDDHGRTILSSSGSLDSFRNSGAAHDTYDKRFHAHSCGCCNDVAGSMPAIGSGCGVCTKNELTTTPAGTMNGASTFPYTGGACVSFNNYKPTTDFLWPNAGAWAGFYSFVTCSNNAYMVYGTATPGSIVISTLAETLGTVAGETRMLVMSGLHTDYRHGRGLNLVGHNVRGNVRQVGTGVKYCDDGDEADPKGSNPVGDTSPWTHTVADRCTWDWNYVVSATHDAELWFDSDFPMHMDAWDGTSQIKHDDLDELIDNPAVPSTDTAHFGFATTVKAGNVVNEPTVTIKLVQGDSSATAPTASGFFFDAAKYFVGTTHSIATNTLTGSGALNCLDSDNSNTAWGAKKMDQRDNFPDCYFGDEIHFEFQFSSYVGKLELFNIWDSYATLA